MKSTLTRAGVLASLAFALLAGCGGDVNPEPKEKAEVIPLDSLVVTFKQEGLKMLHRTPDEAVIRDSERFQAQLESGASNVFVVRGKDIGGAVASARAVLLEGASADTAVPDKEGGENFYWLVAYLGSGPSSPVYWRVKSAEIRGKSIRLTTAVTITDSVSKDSRAYLVWVPLGKLAGGTYTLELVDTKENEPSLVRRVLIKNR